MRPILFYFISVVLVGLALFSLFAFIEDNPTYDLHGRAPQNVSGKKIVIKYTDAQEILIHSNRKVELTWIDQLDLIPSDCYDIVLSFENNNKAKWNEENMDVKYERINSTTSILKFYPTEAYAEIFGIILHFHSSHSFSGVVIRAFNPIEDPNDESEMVWRTFGVGFGISGCISD